MACSGSDTGGGGTPGSGSNRVTRSRSRRSKAESNSLGKRTWRVNSTDRSAGDACLRGLVVGGVVSDDGEFREFMRDVMNARDCGSVIVSMVVVIKGFDRIFLLMLSLLVDFIICQEQE